MHLRSLVFAASMAAAALVGPAAGVAYAGDDMGPSGRDNTPKELKHVGVDEHLDAPLPLDAVFRDHDGKMVRLGDYFGQDKPSLLILAYHSCPVLCGMVQNAAATALKQVAWTVGRDFNLVVLSIDPRDTPETAAAKRASILGEYGRQGAEDGTFFLVGDKTQIDRVATATGFQYEYDERQQQYAHPAVVMMAKPNGQIARYLYGLEYEPTDVRLGLLEAANGRSITTIEKIILYCYHYDPQDGKYTLMATRVMQLGGVVTVIVLGSFLGAMWARERRRKDVGDDAGRPGSGTKNPSGLDHPATVTEN